MPLRLLWRARKNGAYWKNISERFSCFSFAVVNESIWVHAVSVGEAMAAVPLIKALNKLYPHTQIVVTTMTPTGRERLQKAFSNNEVLLLYVPYDYPFAVKRFLRHLNPKILVLIETEIWPNILYYTAQYKIPIVIGNARLSTKSFAGYQRIKSFINSILSGVTMIMAQSKLDAERFQALGIAPHKIEVIGNVKFDISVSEQVWSEANKLHTFFGGGRQIWVAASTHKMEEEKVLVAAKEVLVSMPHALLILVPRHPERFDEVFALCQNEGFKTIRYTQLQDYSLATNVIVGDVMGQLLLFYAVADVAFVGGSLISWGGHNLLEPAALAKPILTGPNLQAFLDISQALVNAHAMIKVNDELELARSLAQLLREKELREQLGVAAHNVVEENRGATQKILDMVVRILK